MTKLHSNSLRHAQEVDVPLPLEIHPSVRPSLATEMLRVADLFASHPAPTVRQEGSEDAAVRKLPNEVFHAIERTIDRHHLNHPVRFRPVLLDSLEYELAPLWKSAEKSADGTVRVLVDMPADLNAMTRKLVKRFATALAEKLHKAEQKYGYSDGWLTTGWIENGECARKLHAHAAKGDPRDVAAYCAFLWHHGASTTIPVSTPPASPKVNKREG